MSKWPRDGVLGLKKPIGEVKQLIKFEQEKEKNKVGEKEEEDKEQIVMIRRGERSLHPTRTNK